MPNTDIFIMSQGSKPGDTPSLGNENIYYDCPTNPLIVSDTMQATGLFVNDSTKSAGTSSFIITDNAGGTAVQPIEIYETGDKLYDTDGNYIGTILLVKDNYIELESNNVYQITNNNQFYAPFTGLNGLV